jgi:membrane-associated phospholipid phosphatase
MRQLPPQLPDLDRIAPAAGGAPAKGTNQAAAADDGQGPTPLLNRRYYENYVRAPFEFLTSPASWTAADWGKAALFAGGFAGLLYVDKPLRDFLQHDARNSVTNDAASVGANVGAPNVLVPAAAAAMAAGIVLGDRREEAATMEAFQSLVLTLGLTEGVKLLARRQRPNESPDDSFRFDGPGPGGSHKSFPSGHTSGAFALASSFAMSYPDDDFVAPVGYGLATLVAWSRLNDDKHWATDVLLGAGIGYGMSYIIHRLNAFGTGKTGVTAGLYLDGETQGIQVTVRF